MPKFIFPRNNQETLVKHASESDANNISFRTNSNFSYPINLLDVSRNNSKSLVISTSIFNLAGFMGILPLSVRNKVYRKHRAKDNSLGDFFDIFNSRNLLFLSQLSSRAGSQLLAGNKKHVQGEHAFTTQRSILSLAGLFAFEGEPSAKAGWKFFAFFSGFFSSHLRNHLNLVQILNYVLKMPVEIQMFSKRWIHVNQDIQGKLNYSPNNSSNLGVNMILGKIMQVYQRNAVVKVGPLDKENFYMLLPDGKLLNVMKEIVKVYWNDSVFVQVHLIRRSESIGKCFLRGSGISNRLGWDTWLLKSDTSKDRADCHFGLLAYGSGQAS